ncbi:Protein canopy-like protein 4 [Frankliniella fusca]|uniref:Protein canopy-like protein 4 n=1 Tax=Frankliniella fusca TaxID=407009 RepID=A0AAE1HBX2_9NEOP|nr:Protein canopy-like protein 4 [Frankliniella fusca]
MSCNLVEDHGPNPKKPRRRHKCCVPLCSNVKTGEVHLHKVPADAATRDKRRIRIKAADTGLKPRLKPYAVPSQKLPEDSCDRVLSSPAKRKNAARESRNQLQKLRRIPALILLSHLHQEIIRYLAAKVAYLVSIGYSCSEVSNYTGNDDLGGAADQQHEGEITAAEKRLLKEIGIQVDLISES